ncbi:uncharacterized protein LOC119273325 [Triticum dicoccoides]|uniref:uncharacterized protein LOC119273325 n=1 Tax=Triticum dicoccoides TaxID=85692 RepID=UPI00189084B8|nr:uncharacterized protein LOC119273325 [Triticum dicoccoides]
MGPMLQRGGKLWLQLLVFVDVWAKPKTISATSEAVVEWTSTTPSSTSCATGTGTVPRGMQYSMFDSGFADGFDPASLGLSFPARLLFTDNCTYAADGCAQQQHKAHGNEMEQWTAALMDSFPFTYAMGHQMSGPPAEATPIAIAEMEGMFHSHLALQSGGGGNGDEGKCHQFHHPPSKRDQRQQHYRSNKGIYRHVVNGNGSGCYNFYSSTSSTQLLLIS